ncbi:MAG: FtsX-like permease family protein [Ruminococcaceae bacterium]|nr:FtsX-like permease family protein [Oscillospiraceae bacterium]
MNIIENIRIAIFSIKTNIMRSLLTMLGIIIGVASVIAVVTVGNGGRDYIIDMLSSMGSSMITITVKSEASPDEFISNADIKALKKIEGVECISPMGYAIGSGSTDRVGIDMAIAIGGNTDLQTVMMAKTKQGRFFSEEEYDSAAKVCVMPNVMASLIFGTTDCVGKYFNLNINNQTVQLKVIGLYDAAASEDMTDMMMESMAGMANMDMASAAMLLVPQTLLDNLNGSSDQYNMIYVTAEDDSQLDAIGNIVSNVLYSRNNNFGSDIYLVQNMATYIDMLDSVIRILTIFIAGVSAISLLVGGIGVMNIMLVSVTERTREIGIRKSLGAKTSTIMFQFLTESVILCLIGGVIGLMLGVVGAYSIASIMDISVSLQVSTVLIAVGFSSAIGIFFGIYPARRAAKMLPIDALRHE